MMKLTVAFLGALAAADAVEARSHRQARRQYYGGGYGGGAEYPNNGGNTAISSVKPVETPKPVESPKPIETPSVPYIQSSADNFKPSIPAVPSFGASSSAAVPVASSKPLDYGNGYGTSPVSSPAKVPSDDIASSSVVVPSGAIPSSGPAKPSGGYGGGFSASSVAAVSSKVPSNSGVYPPAGGVGASGSVVPIYPTGTGSKPSATPVTDMVSKTISSSKLVSTVVPVGTIVYPKDEASATPAVSATSAKFYTSEVPVSEITKKITETLVYTVGVGSTAHPITTEIVSTSTSTIYKTVVITLAKPTPTPGQGYPVGSKPADEETSTKTIKSTSTTTKYITIKPTPASSNVPVGVEGSSVPSTPAGGESCAVPVTVTVTAKETVYVTKGQDNSKSTPAAGKPYTPVPAQPEATSVKPSGGAGVPTKPSAAPSGHYPMHNGTNPYPAGPTGFHTSAKPHVPVGTGGVPVPSKAASSLPAFSFVSEPVKTPSKETGVPVPSATPASASAPPAGGNYGNGASPASSSSKVVVETPTPAVSTPAVPSSKVPSNEQSTPSAKPTPTPVGNGGYGSGYGTY